MRKVSVNQYPVQRLVLVISSKTYRTQRSRRRIEMWTRGKSRGRLASAPMRTEPHPGIKGWLPPHHVPHAGLSLSDRPEYIQGIPGRHFTRGGARTALTPMHAPPAGFSF